MRWRSRWAGCSIDLLSQLWTSGLGNHFDPKNRSVRNWETIKFSVSGVSEKYAQPPPRQENLPGHYSATCFNQRICHHLPTFGTARIETKNARKESMNPWKNAENSSLTLEPRHPPRNSCTRRQQGHYLKIKVVIFSECLAKTSIESNRAKTKSESKFVSIPVADLQWFDVICIVLYIPNFWIDEFWSQTSSSKALEEPAPGCVWCISLVHLGETSKLFPLDFPVLISHSKLKPDWFWNQKSGESCKLDMCTRVNLLKSTCVVHQTNQIWSYSKLPLSSHAPMLRR